MPEDSVKFTARVWKFPDNINTDLILPNRAFYLTPEEQAKFVFSANRPGWVDLVQPGDILIGGKNFGCGSSREHAPFALQVAGIEAVIAEGYARIFYRNSIDGAFVAPFESFEHLAKEVRTGDELELDTTKGILKNLTQKKEYLLKPLGDIEHILRGGGIFEYARKSGMLQKS